MNTPAPPVPPPSPERNKGSLLAGFFIGWGVVIGSAIIAVFVIGVISQIPAVGRVMAPFSMLVALLPQVALLGAIIWAFTSGRTRTGGGILVALASMIALAILLVAACFGMMGGLNLH